MQKSIFDLRNEITKEVEKQIKDILPEKDSKIEKIKVINVNIMEGDSLNESHQFIATADLTIKNSNMDLQSDIYDISGSVKINTKVEIEVSNNIIYKKRPY